MLRVMTVVPVPHGLLHVEGKLQSSETSQFTGHGCSLHGPVSAPAGQLTPPHTIGVITVRLRKRAPPPQAALQLLHEPHSETTQLPGQHCGWQDSVSWVDSHPIPPQDA